MRLRLKQLIVITCVALGGIICLQLFWLVKTYAEKKSQLQTTVNNTMVEAQALTGVTPILSNTFKVIAGDIIDSLTDINSSDSEIRLIRNAYAAEGRTKVITLGDSSDKEDALKLLWLENNMAKEYTIGAYKEQLARALAYKGVTIPFHLALLDTDNHIIACTTDSASFINIKEKTEKGFSLPVKLKDHPAGQLQMAIPGMAIYLLKDMALIWASALLLILVCCFSFYHMVRMFFKEKKLADIRNDFMNNMTHELKTPISSASLALALMQDSSVVMTDADKQDYIQVAESELKRLSMLVDKVLKMAALERTEVLLQQKDFQAAGWLQHVVSILKPLADRYQVRIDTIITPNDMTIRADQEYLSGVVQNLLENAIKYRDKAKPQTIIKIAISRDDTYYRITVTDNGTGIPRQYIDKIFDKFFRVPMGDRHDNKGYGLGLSYAYEIVRLHGGSISVVSEEQAGTSFEIRLPKSMVV